MPRRSLLGMKRLQRLLMRVSGSLRMWVVTVPAPNTPEPCLLQRLPAEFLDVAGDFWTGRLRTKL